MLNVYPSYYNFFFLLFIKKISSYIKKNSLFLYFSEKIFFAKCKNSKPRTKFRNISNYVNKSAKDLIKALSGSRPRLGIKKNKLKEVKEDFYNLRNKFSEKDADKYRKLFYYIKNYRTFSELEIEEKRKKFDRLEKSLNFKKPRKNINTVHCEDLNSDKELHGRC